MPKAGKYKWISSLRVLVYNGSIYITLNLIYIQINNKTIIEFGSRRIRGIIKASVCVIDILLDLIQ